MLKLPKKTCTNYIWDATEWCFCSLLLSILTVVILDLSIIYAPGASLVPVWWLSWSLEILRFLVLFQFIHLFGYGVLPHLVNLLLHAFVFQSNLQQPLPVLIIVLHLDNFPDDILLSLLGIIISIVFRQYNYKAWWKVCSVLYMPPVFIFCWYYNKWLVFCIVSSRKR